MFLVFSFSLVAPFPTVLDEILTWRALWFTDRNWFTWLSSYRIVPGIERKDYGRKKKKGIFANFEHRVTAISDSDPVSCIKFPYPIPSNPPSNQ